MVCGHPLVPQCMCGGQERTCASLFSPTIWVPGNKLKASGLMAGHLSRPWETLQTAEKELEWNKSRGKGRAEGGSLIWYVVGAEYFISTMYFRGSSRVICGTNESSAKKNLKWRSLRFWLVPVPLLTEKDKRKGRARKRQWEHGMLKEPPEWLQASGRLCPCGSHSGGQSKGGIWIIAPLRSPHLQWVNQHQNGERSAATHLWYKFCCCIT